MGHHLSKSDVAALCSSIGQDSQFWQGVHLRTLALSFCGIMGTIDHRKQRMLLYHSRDKDLAWISRSAWIYEIIPSIVSWEYCNRRGLPHPTLKLELSPNSSLTVHRSLKPRKFVANNGAAQNLHSCTAKKEKTFNPSLEPCTAPWNLPQCEGNKSLHYRHCSTSLIWEAILD